MASARTQISHVISTFIDVAGKWNLLLEQNSNSQFEGTHVINFNDRSGNHQLLVRIVAIFGDTVMFYLSKASTRIVPVHVKISNFYSDHGEFQCNDVALSNFFDRNVFFPLLKPDQEFSTLSLLCSTSIQHVLGYLKARDLCNVAITSTRMHTETQREALWEALLAKDYLMIDHKNSSAYHLYKEMYVASVMRLRWRHQYDKLLQQHMHAVEMERQNYNYGVSWEGDEPWDSSPWSIGPSPTDPHGISPPLRLPRRLGPPLPMYPFL